MVAIQVTAVAGLFLALGIAGFLFVSSGQGVSTLGVSTNLPIVIDMGKSLSGLGFNIILLLAILAIVVVGAFVVKSN